MRPGRWLRRGVTLLSLGAAGTALVVTTRHLLETPQPLESTLPGEGQIDRKHGGNIYYNVAGPRDAQPLVLLHDFYPGASNYEYRHVFPRFATDYRVYAPDWLGFGLSEHPNIAYTGEFFAAVLTGFLRDVVKRPAIVIGAGNAANAAVRAASDTPDLFTRVVLVSPNAMAGLDLEPSMPQVLARAAQRVSLGMVPYAFLSTRPVLRRVRDTRAVRLEGNLTQDESLDHLYASAHQFGGHHALVALMTGELDLPIQNALALLTPPALIISGEDDPQHPREEMEDLAVLSPHTDLEILPGAGAAVAEDQPALFVDAVTTWLRGLSHAPELGDQVLFESLTVETILLPGTEETTAPEDLGDLSQTDERDELDGEPPVSAVSAPAPMPPAADIADEEENPVAAELTAPEAAAAEAGPTGLTGTTDVTTPPEAVTTPEDITTPEAVTTQNAVTQPEATESPTGTNAGTSTDITTGTDEVVTRKVPRASAPATPAKGMGLGSAPTLPAPGRAASASRPQPRPQPRPQAGSQATPSAASSTTTPSNSASAVGPTSVPVRTPPHVSTQAQAQPARASETGKPTFAERRDPSSRKTQPRSRTRSNSRPRSPSSANGPTSGDNRPPGTTNGTRHHHHEGHNHHHGRH